MKTIESKDLVIGQEYYDIDTPHRITPVVLRFEKHYNGRIYFTQISGDFKYFTNPEVENLVGFLEHCKFYQP